MSECKFFGLTLGTWQCPLVFAVVGTVILVLLCLTIVFGVSRRILRLKYLKLKEEVRGNNVALVETTQQENVSLQNESAKEVDVNDIVNQIESESTNLVQNADEQQLPIEVFEVAQKKANGDGLEKMNGIPIFSKQKSIESLNVNTESSFPSSNAMTADEKLKNNHQGQQKQSVPHQPYETAVVNSEALHTVSSFSISSTKPESNTPYLLAMKTNAECPYNLPTDTAVVEEANDQELLSANDPAIVPSFKALENNTESETPYAIAMKTPKPDCPYSVAEEAVTKKFTQISDNPPMESDTSYDRLFSSKPRDDGLAYDEIVLPNRNTIKSRNKISNFDEKDLPPPPVPPPYVPSDDEEHDVTVEKKENVYDLPPTEH